MAKKVAGTAGLFAANTKTVVTRVGDMACVKHDKFIGHSLDIYGEWAQNEIDRLLEYVRPGDFVIDVGANVGFHSLSFARRVGQTGTVWAFEPDPVNGLLLRLNIVNSGLHGTVIPFDLALSNELGPCRFRSYPISMPENFGHTAIDADAGNYPRVAIPVDLLGIEQAPSLIKIDIEGGERLALEGMRELIERFGPVLSVEADSEDEAEAIASQIAALGYDVHDFVTDAFNPANFASREKDIWNGHGRCANLLCIKPGKHASPKGMHLRRAAALEVQGLVKVGRRIGAAYSSSVDRASLSDREHVGEDVESFRGDVRNFVGAFLRSTYGKLDPNYYGTVVNCALDYLSADGPEVEGKALRSFVVSGIDAFAGAVTRARDDAEQLVRLEAELVQARPLASQLEDAKARQAEAEQSGSRLAAELEELQAQYQSALDTLERLAAASQSSEQELSLARGEAQSAREIADNLNRALAQHSMAATAEMEKLKSELAAAAKACEEELSLSRDEAQNAREIADNLNRALAQQSLAASAEMENLKGELVSAQQSLADVKESSAKQIEALMRAVETSEQAMRTVTQERDGARKDAETAQAALRASEMASEAALAEQMRLRELAQKELRDQGRKLKAAQAEHELLRAELESNADEHAKVVKSVHSEMDQLRMNLDVERHDMTIEIANLRAEHADALNRLAAQAQEIRRLRAVS